MKLHFHKYHGTGNDFILVDDLENKINLSTETIAQLCDRRFGIGADGLILMKTLAGFDFQMIYYNADGKQSSMCGNGGRCLTAFAKRIGKINKEAKFSAIDGIHQAFLTGESPTIVKLQMNDVSEIKDQKDFLYLNTGSPHVVRFVEDVSSLDVVDEAKKIRFSEQFKADGVNVNFVQKSGKEFIVRTYERGVEDETLSCGTGVIASAIAGNALGEWTDATMEVSIQTKGGRLKVYFERTASGFNNIWLEGEATFVYKGEIEI